MTRILRRLKDVELTLHIKSDSFIRPPRDMQRTWLLNRVVKEFTDELDALARLAPRFVRGDSGATAPDFLRPDLSDSEIMEDWQIPLMEAMADEVTGRHGDVLEIGFGRGIASDLIQQRGVKSHTVIECNDGIIERFHSWRQRYPDSDIKLVPGRWQDVVDKLGQYDGILFHTVPLDENEVLEHVVRDVTYAAHFFPTASAHLRSSGAFTYMTNEIDSFSRAHQRLVFENFSSLSLRVIKLDLPDDSKDRWWADSMVVARAVK